MKLIVPIKKKEIPVGSSLFREEIGFNECLDELSQCEVSFSELELAKLICNMEDGFKWDEWSKDAKQMYINKANKIIAAMPSILSIMKGI